MTPILKSGQPVICKPVTKDTLLKKNDIVLCKVKGNYYLHKISAIKNGVSYQISNNHGHVNGTINKKQYLWNCGRNIITKKRRMFNYGNSLCGYGASSEP